MSPNLPYSCLFSLQCIVFKIPTDVLFGCFKPDHRCFHSIVWANRRAAPKSWEPLCLILWCWFFMRCCDSKIRRVFTCFNATQTAGRESNKYHIRWRRSCSSKMLSMCLLSHRHSSIVLMRSLHVSKSPVDCGGAGMSVGASDRWFNDVHPGQIFKAHVSMWDGSLFKSS